MFKKILFFAFSGLLIISCSSDDSPNVPMSTISINLSGLEVLSGGFEYEGWVMVNGTPQSTGTFTNPAISQSFTMPSADLDIATAFILSIESDDDPAPSNTKIMSGNFIGNANSVTLSLENQVPGILNMAGKFILASPTDALDNDEAGVWFMDPPNAGLTSLPSLGAGWKYEGWVVVGENNDIVLSTGKFDTATGSDSSSFFSGNLVAPAFPGEDFIATGVAIPGLLFPLDLRGKKVVVSIEPEPDNSSEPFVLKPLVGTASSITGTASVNTMTLNNASFPTGTVTR